MHIIMVPCIFSSKRLILTIFGKMVTLSSVDKCNSNDLYQNKRSIPTAFACKFTILMATTVKPKIFKD